MVLPAWMMLLVAPVIGSWLGVLIRRWPQQRPIAIARSACEHCGHVLAPGDLVPVLSFLLLRGRCRYCGGAIGLFHPAVELAALTIAAIVFLAGPPGWAGWAGVALGWTLLAAAWIDAETFRLPDFLILPLILAGLAVTWALAPDALYNHAAAAALAYLGFRALDAGYFALRRRHGLGAGDAKLLAAAGAWTGLVALPLIILTAGLLGIFLALGLRRRHEPIPFGPPLALSFFLWWLAGQGG